MTLFPLVLFVFSLIGGHTEMGGKTSDVKGEIMGRYKGCQVEEPAHETISEESESPDMQHSEEYS